MISHEDFLKIDIRAGTVISSEAFPKARNPAYRLLIDFGELGKKTSSAQITSLYHFSDLVGRQVIAVVNLPPRQIANFSSECLLLGVCGENNSVILLEPERPVKNGSRIG